MRFRDHDVAPRDPEFHDPGDEDDALDFDAWLAAWQRSNRVIVEQLRRTLTAAETAAAARRQTAVVHKPA